MIVILVETEEEIGPPDNLEYHEFAKYPFLAGFSTTNGCCIEGNLKNGLIFIPSAGTHSHTSETGTTSFGDRDRAVVENGNDLCIGRKYEHN